MPSSATGRNADLSWTTRIALAGELCDFSTHVPMHRIRRKHITLAVLCALPLAAKAEDAAKPGEGIQLKPSRSLLSLPAAREEPVPVFIEADRLEGETEKEARAEGNVELRRLGQSVYADRLRFDTPRQELEASGNVRLEYEGSVLQGERLRFNLRTERGFMDQPVFKFTPIPRSTAAAQAPE